MNPLIPIVSFLVSLILIPPAMRIAYRLGAIDAQNADVRTHTQDTPLLGGIGIVGGTLVAAFLVADTSLSLYSILAFIAVLTLGFYKDITRSDVAPTIQLLVQIIACLLIMNHNNIIQNFHSWELLVILVGGLALINAINFIDVMDGLCTIVVAFISIGFFLITSLELSLALAAACLSFFIWNRPKAKIFMGDVGSFFIGLILFHLAVSTLAMGYGTLPILLILAVPLLELTATIGIRFFRGKSITTGDASHVSLIMLNRGTSPWAIISLFAGISFICILASYLIIIS